MIQKFIIFNYKDKIPPVIIFLVIIIQSGRNFFMSYDGIASLQRIQQMQQAEAAAGKRLVLHRTSTGLEVGLAIGAFILLLPTLTLSAWAYAIYYFIKEVNATTYLVKNVATGEKFRVDKEEFKQYKKNFKEKEKEVRSISDLK